MTDPRTALTILEQATHAATKAALDDMAQTPDNAARVDVTTAGVEARIERTWANGWGVIAYAKKLWRGGPVEAGGRIEKRW